LLQEIDALDDRATGALVVGTQPQPLGTILVEEGRICWAAASGMSRRLTDLLRTESDPPIGKDVIEEVYRSCKTNGQPLGEALVERGIVSAGGLRKALRQHTSESLLQLVSESQRAWKWVEHRHRRYDARFAFDPIDILTGIGATIDAEVSRRAEALLDRFRGTESALAVYARELYPTGPFPVAALGGQRMDVSALMALGCWAREVVDVSRGVVGECEVCAGLSNDGRTAVAWPEDELLLAGLCENGMQFSRLLSKKGVARR
jgi:hypothetical protein